MKYKSLIWAKKHPILVSLAIGFGAILFIYLLHSSGSQSSERDYIIKDFVLSDIENKNDPVVSKEYSNTQEGYTLAIKGYKFEKKGEDWGAIKEISFTATNSQGSNVLYPSILVEIEDPDGTRNEKIIDLTEILYPGKSTSLVVQTNIQIAEISKTKIFRGKLFEKFGRVYVTTSFETNFSEGFK